LLEDRIDYPGAEKGFKDAFATARAARHDEVMRNSAIALVRVIGTEEARPADADEWIKSARAEVKRAETDVSAKTRLLENEADVDLTAGRYRDSKGKLAEVLQIREGSLPANDPDIGVAHWNLGAALEHLHEYDAALVERTKAFDVMKAAYGEDSPMAANYARGVADIQYRLGKYDEARAAYEKALETYTHFPDVESDVSTTHEQLARVLRAMKQPSLAVDQMNESIAIREKLVGPNHPFVAGELKNLADALDDAGRSAEALAALERASNIMANTYGKDSAEGADITCARADVTSNLGHQEDAIVLYEKAIADVTRAFGPNDPKIGRYAFNLGLARKKKGDFAGAVAAYAQAATVFESAYGSDARETKLAGLALDEAKKRTAK
jgi:tetratricopeptide (TPR) repeat protein